MGALTSLATLGLNFALAQQAAKKQSREIKAERDRQIRAIAQQTEDQRRRQREILRRRLAAQRARAGAAGVAGPSTSSEAVLRGLIEESEIVQQARENQATQRIARLRDTARRSRRRNLLDLVGTLGSGILGGRRSRRRSLLDF